MIEHNHKHDKNINYNRAKRARRHTTEIKIIL
jgi:hypothetical protein